MSLSPQDPASPKDPSAGRSGRRVHLSLRDRSTEALVASSADAMLYDAILVAKRVVLTPAGLNFLLGGHSWWAASEMWDLYCGDEKWKRFAVLHASFPFYATGESALHDVALCQEWSTKLISPAAELLRLLPIRS